MVQHTALCVWICLLLLVDGTLGTEPSASAVDSSFSSEKYFALCLMAKATRQYEHYDIKEFVDYHLKIGTSVIYLFDDGSPVPFNGTIREHIDSGAVHYTFIGQ